MSANRRVCDLTEEQLEASAELTAWLLGTVLGWKPEAVVRSLGTAFTPGIKAHFDGLEHPLEWVFRAALAEALGWSTPIPEEDTEDLVHGWATETARQLVTLLKRAAAPPPAVTHPPDPDPTLGPDL